jgi:hypothetical protein
MSRTTKSPMLSPPSPAIGHNSINAAERNRRRTLDRIETVERGPLNWPRMSAESTPRRRTPI